MRRILLGIVVVVAALIALPPLWFAVAGAERPELPPPGTRVELPDGRGLNVVERGSGPPVVLVHGLPGTAYDWQPLTEALAARGRHVLAVDRAGYGHSDPRPDDADYTLDANADDVLALLEALDLRDVTLVGWSYGGGTAIVAARRDPSRLSSIVLVGSMGPREEPPPQPPLVFRALLWGPVLAWVQRVPPVVGVLRRGMSEAAFSGQPWPDWWLPQLAANLGRPHATHAWLTEAGHITGQEDLDPSGIARPVLVVQGTDDRFVPMSVAEALHTRSPQAELLAVDGGSHMLPITHPELLAERIVAFPEGSTR